MRAPRVTIGVTIALAATPLLIPVQTAADEEPPRSIPGNWEPLGDSVAPYGILPPFGGDVLRRPDVAVQPGSGNPAVAVHYGGLLQMLAVSYSGTLMRIDRDTGQSTVLALAPGYEWRGLAFDSNADVLYGLLNDELVRVEIQTGLYQSIGYINPEFHSLAFDREFDTLYSVWVYPDQPGGPSILELYRIGQQSAAQILIGTASLPGEYWGVTGLAFDTDQFILYGILADLAGEFQLAEIDPLTAETMLIGQPTWVPILSLAYDEATGALFGGSEQGGPLLMIEPGSGTVTPVGYGLIDGAVGLATVNRQQDGLHYLEYDSGGGAWIGLPIDNEQDSFIDGCMTHTPPTPEPDPNLGRIDGICLAYGDDGRQPYPLVAWAQRADNVYSEILVARGDAVPFPSVFTHLGVDAFGTPSNRLPGISRTLRDSTDPVIAFDAYGNPVVAWQETVTPGQHEVYARRYDPFHDQWLEIGDGSASADGISNSGGTSHGFDLIEFLGVILLVHAHDGYIVIKFWDEATEQWLGFDGAGLPGSGSVSGELGGNDNEPVIASYPGSDSFFVTWIRNGTEVMGRQWIGGWWGEEVIHTAPLVTHPTALSTLGGELVVAWQEEQTTPWSQVLAKYRDEGVWGEIGPGSSSSGGISGSAAPSRYPRLTVWEDGRPVITWEEDSLAFLRRFSPSIEPDCNTNGVPDALDVRDGTSADCNDNRVPDECEMFDHDGDGNVDGDDLTAFAPCMLGPGNVQYFCRVFDGNCDGGVDTQDFAMMQTLARVLQP